MKTYKSKLKDFEASVSIPDVWTSGDVWLYYDTLTAASREMGEDTRLVETRFAAVLALVASGRVKVDIPGVDVRDDEIDLSGMDARAVTFLVQTVALSVEATQNVPFELSES